MVRGFAGNFQGQLLHPLVALRATLTGEEVSAQRLFFGRRHETVHQLFNSLLDILTVHLTVHPPDRKPDSLSTDETGSCEHEITETSRYPPAPPRPRPLPLRRGLRGLPLESETSTRLAAFPGPDQYRTA